MALVFGDGTFSEERARRLWLRVFAGADSWHNRVFSPRQSIETTADGCIVRWSGRGEFHARHGSRLPRRGHLGVILASGPSVARLERPERLFRLPVTCVNGSVALPHQFCRRCDWLLALERTTVHLVEDPLHPFKRRRPSRQGLRQRHARKDLP